MTQKKTTPTFKQTRIKQLLGASALVVALGIGMTSMSQPVLAANYDEAMAAFEKRDYGSAYKDFLVLANEGNRDAQFMLGYLYSRGYGTIQDYVQAHKWFNLAASQGDGEAKRARDSLAQSMTLDQISEAQRLAREWQPASPEPEAEPEEEPEIVWSQPEPAPAPLTRDEKREFQRLLREAGYNPGPIDGLPGEMTRRALRNYQADRGLPVDGEINRAMLETLRQSVTMPGTAPDPGEAATALKDKEDELIRQVRALAKEGRESNLGRDEYQRRLEAILDDFDRPWSVRVLFDSFLDGDFTSNPRWYLESGEFDVSSRDYLHSAVAIPRSARSTSERKSDREKIVGILTDILEGAAGEQEDKPTYTGYAEIYTPVRINNSFSIRMDLTGMIDDGRLVFGPYIGSARINGYRLAYQTGPNSRLEILRTTSQGQISVETIALSQSLSARPHTVEWQREEGGRMTVLLDDQVMFSTVDRELNGAFDGFVIGNHGGDFRIHEVEIYEEP